MSKEQWFWSARNTNIFSPPVAEKQGGFKCPVCFKKFKKAGKRNKHIKEKHPSYRGPNSANQQVNVQPNPDNVDMETDPMPARSSRKRKKKKASKSKKNKRRVTEAHKELGLPLLQSMSQGLKNELFMPKRTSGNLLVRKKSTQKKSVFQYKQCEDGCKIFLSTKSLNEDLVI